MQICCEKIKQYIVIMYVLIPLLLLLSEVLMLISNNNDICNVATYIALLWCGAFYILLLNVMAHNIISESLDFLPFYFY